MRKFFGLVEAPKKSTVPAAMAPTPIDIANKLTDVVKNPDGTGGDLFLDDVQSFIESKSYTEQIKKNAKCEFSISSESGKDSKENQGPLVQAYQTFLSDSLSEMAEGFVGSYGAYLEDAESCSSQLKTWKDNYYGFVEALGAFSALFEDASLMQAVSGQAGLMNEWLQPSGSPPLERLITIKQRLESYLGKNVPPEGKLDFDSEPANVKKKEILTFIDDWYGKVSDEMLESYKDKDIQELQLGWRLADFHLKWIKQSVKTPFEKLSEGSESLLFREALGAVLKAYETLKLGSISQLPEMSELLQKNAVQLAPPERIKAAEEKLPDSDDKSSSLWSTSLDQMNFDKLDSSQLMDLIGKIAGEFDILSQQKKMLQSVESNYGKILELLIPTFNVSDQISRFESVTSMLMKQRPEIVQKLLEEKTEEKAAVAVTDEKEKGGKKSDKSEEEDESDNDIYQDESENQGKRKVKEKEKQKVSICDKVIQKWKLRENRTPNGFFDLALVLDSEYKKTSPKAENFLKIAQVRVKVVELVDNILKRAELLIKAPKPAESGVFKALDDLGEMKSYQAIDALQSRMSTAVKELYTTDEKAPPVAELCIQMHTQYKKYRCPLIELRETITKTPGYQTLNATQLAEKFPEWRPSFEATFTELAVLKHNLNQFIKSKSTDNSILMAITRLREKINAVVDALRTTPGSSPSYLMSLRQYWEQEIDKYKPAPPATSRNGSRIFGTPASSPVPKSSGSSITKPLQLT